MALHTSTILAQKSATILSYLSRLSATYSNHSLLFCLSANAPDLPALVSCLTTLSPQNIGCLTAPLPGLASEGLISCSLAVLDKQNAVSFRSTIPGRAAPQVGRWHAFRKKDHTSVGQSPPSMEAGLGESVSWDDVWNRNAVNTEVPPDLQALRPDDVNCIIYFSDNAPEGLSNALTSFPNAIKLGLIASSTPFITGRPVTLFRNGNVHSSGAVGIALTGENVPKSHIDFPGLKAITLPLTVTRTEGNLVNELNHENPTRLLLSAIQKNEIEGKGSFKDDDFYLGAFRDNKLSQVYHITSGDPSRGAISLESHAAPVEGTIIKLYHHQRDVCPEVPTRYAQHHPQHSKSLAFVATASDMTPEATTPKDGDDENQLFPDSFIASSENGFLLSRSRNENAWRCTIAGGLAGLEWF